jgi:hypothetical protein
MHKAHLSNLPKEILIEIICTIGHDKDKQISKLSAIEKKYNYLVAQINQKPLDFIGADKCDICECIELISETDGAIIDTCNICHHTYHYKCKPICITCAKCSDCNQIEYHSVYMEYYHCHDCFPLKN